MASRPTSMTNDTQSDATPLTELRRLAQADPVQAVELAARAKAHGVTDPLVHLLLGRSLKEAGHPEEAIIELGLGLQLEPQNVDLLTTVGFCLLDLNRRQESAQVFEAALKQDPSSVDASYGYGWAAERLGALEQAGSAWARTILLNPNHADALAGLSGLAVRRRDWTTARDYAERAAALDPLQTDALMNLARVAIGLGQFEDAEARLRALLPLRTLVPLAKANAHIMLGDALDGQRRYDEALDSYTRGKAALRDLHAPAFERPGVASAVDGVVRILDEFRATPPSAWIKPARSPDLPEYAGHAFLMGFPRSGTTLLEQVLATHSDIVTLEERPIMLKAEVEFLTRVGGIGRLADVVSDSLAPLREDYWRRVRELGVEVRDKVFVDKQPLHTFRLPLIAKLFPEAKILFALRDPRDVVLSCFRRSFNMNASMYQFNTLEGAATYYAAVMEAGETYIEALPVEVLRLRYEDLVRDFTGVSRGLCDFLGVDWTDRLKDFADTANARAIATPSSTQVGRGLYDEGVGQWHRYEKALAPVQGILRPWIERYGYALD